jgi:hypothetical protein
MYICILLQVFWPWDLAIGEWVDYDQFQNAVIGNQILWVSSEADENYSYLAFQGT